MLLMSGVYVHLFQEPIYDGEATCNNKGFVIFLQLGREADGVPVVFSVKPQ